MLEFMVATRFEHILQNTTSNILNHCFFLFASSSLAEHSISYRVDSAHGLMVMESVKHIHTKATCAVVRQGEAIVNMPMSKH